MEHILLGFLDQVRGLPVLVLHAQELLLELIRYKRDLPCLLAVACLALSCAPSSGLPGLGLRELFFELFDLLLELELQLHLLSQQQFVHFAEPLVFLLMQELLLVGVCHAPGQVVDAAGQLFLEVFRCCQFLG